MTGDFLRRNRAGVTLLFLSSFSFAALTLRLDATIIGVKTIVWYLLSPEIVYSGQFFNKLDSLGGNLFRLFHVEGENYILRSQIAELSKRDIERDALQDENERLRTILNLKTKTFPQAIAAEVVSRDVRDWFHAAVINKGKADGVVFSAAVVAGMSTHPTLVGRILEVKDDTSKVLLVTDAVSAVSVTIPGRGDIGLLEGRNKPWLVLNYLSLNSEVAVGDDVVTIGLGGAFPPGIPVGKVGTVELSPDGYFKTARVVPHAALNALREVLVLSRQDKEEK